MMLPKHIADQIAEVVARTSPVGGHLDNEAARYGAIGLMGDMGGIRLLRPDGTFWEVSDETGKPPSPLDPKWHHGALVCGAKRFPWLSELIPVRPADAITCETCKGKGEVYFDGKLTGLGGNSGILCGKCFIRGWREVDSQ